MGKLGRLGLEPAQRYERERPGELIHIAVKKLGRIHAGAGHRVTGKRGRYTGQRTDAEGVRRKTVGWEFVHIAIDDATRLAYVEVRRFAGLSCLFRHQLPVPENRGIPSSNLGLAVSKDACTWAVFGVLASRREGGM